MSSSSSSYSTEASDEDELSESESQHHKKKKKEKKQARKKEKDHKRHKRELKRELKREKKRYKKEKKERKRMRKERKRRRSPSTSSGSSYSYSRSPDGRGRGGSPPPKRRHNDAGRHRSPRRDAPAYRGHRNRSRSPAHAALANHAAAPRSPMKMPDGRPLTIAEACEAAGRGMTTGQTALDTEVKVYGPDEELVDAVRYDTFDDARDFPREIIKELKHAGFPGPSQIQAWTWPLGLRRKDIIGIAATGSGKTLAFLLPAFTEMLDEGIRPERDGPGLLVMSPTRELVQQTEQEATRFGRCLNFRCVAMYGGSPKGNQMSKYRQGCHTIVACPGRLNDFLDAGQVRLDGVMKLVLDEADRMLDMGFEPQIRKILSKVPRKRHTLFFTATWPREVRKLAGEILTRPYKVMIGNRDQLKGNQEIKVAKVQTGLYGLTLRAWATVPGVDMHAAFYLFFNVQERVKWDKVFAQMEIVQDKVQGSDILYSLLKVSGVTPRDFLQYRRMRVEEDGSIVMVMRSAEHPDKPEDKRYIRAESFISGYVFRQTFNGQTPILNIFIMSSSDIKGLIPKWMINYFAPKKPAEWVETLKKVCLEYQEQHPGFKEDMVKNIEKQHEEVNRDNPYDYEPEVACHGQSTSVSRQPVNTNDEVDQSNSQYTLIVPGSKAPTERRPPIRNNVSINSGATSRPSRQMAN